VALVLEIQTTKEQAVISHAAEYRGHFSRVSERVNLPPNMRTTTCSKSVIQLPKIRAVLRKALREKDFLDNFLLQKRLLTTLSTFMFEIYLSYN